MPEMTVPLYDQDAYRERFDAVALSCEPGTEGNTYRVILDRSCFFPEQGGQTADTGVLSGVRVLDARMEKGVIVHITDGPLTAGKTVTGEIDFAHRFSHMQQHTGEHIFSGLVCAQYHCHNVGFHLSNRTVTMDYDVYLTMEQLLQIELQANQVIWKNLPVQISWPTEEEQQSIPYRSKKEIDGPLRLVTIPGVDICACCAPHVRYTGEVGVLRVMSAIRYKGGVRVNILCGQRALLAARQDGETMTELSRLLSCPREEIMAQVSSLQQKEKDLAARLEQVRARTLMDQVAQADPKRRNIVLCAQDIQEKTASAAADALLRSRKGICGILFTQDGAARVLLLSGHYPLRDAAARLRRETGFKGGGDDSCIRGLTSLDAEALTRWLDDYTEGADKGNA